MITVTHTLDKPAWQQAFDRINARHFDFLLCRPDDLQPLCAFELKEPPPRLSRPGRDNFLAEVCSSASLPLLAFPAQRSYSVAEIRAALLEVLPVEACKQLQKVLIHDDLLRRPAGQEAPHS